MSFPYKSLKHDEIRLLKLVSRDSKPAFELFHVPVHSKPSYAALSYQWGPEGDDFKIEVDGHQFAIRQNLKDALHQILESKLIDRHIWIDAICINQDSEDEKSVHIGDMRQIYEEAAKVLVWLGKPPNVEQNKLAFTMMEDFRLRLMKYQKDLHFKQWSSWLLPRKAQNLGNIQADFLFELAVAENKSIFDIPGSSTHQAWLGIISLWQSEWWTRTWVFQEATIPERSWGWIIFIFNKNLTIPSKVKFLFGDQQTDWPGLLVTSTIAEHISRTPEIDSSLLSQKPAVFESMNAIRFWRVTENLPSFLDIVRSFRMTNCSDARDKVYAPLCLAPDDIRHAMAPDYKNKTTSDVYIDVVRCQLAQDASKLDFFGHIMHQEGSNVVQISEGVASTLPSWVPNYSHKLIIYPIPKILHLPLDLESRRYAPFNDLRGLPSNKDAKQPSYQPLAITSPEPYIDGPALCVSGVLIDSVKDIIVNAIPGLDKEAVLNAAREKSQKWHSDGNNKYFTGESFNGAYNRALVLDLVFDYHNRPAGRGGKYDAELQKKSSANLTAAESKHQREMKQAFLQAIISRSPALSQDHYILIVPETTEIGDLIWAFVGGRALYVLRPIDRDTNQYTFIGECYAHGLMDGELDQRLDRREAKVEQIRLI